MNTGAKRLQLAERVMFTRLWDCPTGRIVGCFYGDEAYDVELDDGRRLRAIPPTQLRRLS